ncbi:MAG: tyrosine-type recombinase/integrase [Acetobacteraceae bacterium]
MPSHRGSSPADRVVRHTLADGTVREYRYPRGRKQKREHAPDSLAAMIDAYRISPEWRGLRDSTRINYAIYLRPLEEMGHILAAAVRRKDIMTLRDAIAEARGNGAATGFVRAASALFGWAVDREWVTHSPVARVKTLPGGHLRAWTEGEANQAEAELPPHLARVVTLARYTGQRRTDLCRMGWSAYDGRAIRLVQQKTGAPLVIPCHPKLKAALDEWPRIATTILTDQSGRPWKPEYLSHALPAALPAIGLSNEINVHGLRKLAATALAEAGCSVREIAAVTGHQTLAMVQLYTDSVDQQKLAAAAIVRLSGRK